MRAWELRGEGELRGQAEREVKLRGYWRAMGEGGGGGEGGGEGGGGDNINYILGVGGRRTEEFVRRGGRLGAATGGNREQTG